MQLFPARAGGRLRAGRDVPVASVYEAEDAVADQAECGEAEEPRPVRAVGELLQGTVEPDGFLRVVLERSLADEDPDQREHDSSGHVADHARARPPRALGATHATAPLVLEFLAHPAPDVPYAGPEDRDRCDADEPPAGGPVEDRRRRLL